MKGLDAIIEKLSNGRSCEFEKICRAAPELNEDQVELALKLLESVDFLKCWKKKWSTRIRKAKLTPVMLRFVTRIKECEDPPRQEETWE